jgi:hypothetical protein
MANTDESCFMVCASDGAADAWGAAHHSSTSTCAGTCLGIQMQLIELREPEVVTAWTQWLGCTEARLRMAVAAVGPELAEVCNHLGTLVPALPCEPQSALQVGQGRSARS